MKSYDLAIIGSGPGGYVAALYASRHNLKTCIIEKDLIGGTCLNRGCIPTKAMLRCASILCAIKESSDYGINVSGYSVNFPKIASRKEEIVLRLRTGIETLLRANKVDVVRGTAVLGSPSVVKVSGQDDIQAKNIIIAAGSKTASLPSIKIDDVNILSSDSVLSMKELPKSMLIVGGGVIGCEFASLFNALGVKVTIAELFDRIIPSQSQEASKKLQVIFKKRGIEVFTSSSVESVSGRAPLKASISGGRTVEADKVLVSVGRIPATGGLGLEEAGVKIEKGRIAVDEFLKTNVKGIYAIGDCVKGPLLAHKASYDGILACDNILGHARSVDYTNVPSCIYTDPEIASIGLGEEEAKAQFPGAKTAKFPYLASGKAYLMGKSEGYIKITGDKDGKFLGCEIMGEGACDLISEGVIFKTLGLNIKDLANIVHGHPTLSEIFQEAAHVFCGSAIHSV